MTKCCCGEPRTTCLVHDIFTTADGFRMPFGKAPETAPTLPAKPKIAPSFELFVFENRHNEVCARLTMQDEVGCPVVLSSVEALALVRLMGALSRRCEKWSQRTGTQVLPEGT